MEQSAGPGLSDLDDQSLTRENGSTIRSEIGSRKDNQQRITRKDEWNSTLLEQVVSKGDDIAEKSTCKTRLNRTVVRGARRKKHKDLQAAKRGVLGPRNHIKTVVGGSTVYDGDVSMHDLSVTEPSKERAPKQVAASHVVKETVSEEDETRLNMEKELLWEGVRQKLCVGNELVEYRRRWEYGVESDFDRLLTETAKSLQIVSEDKIAIHWKVRANIAKETRS